MPLRAVLFDVGNTLIGWTGASDPWRPVVLAAIEREFGRVGWAEAVYDADIRRPPADDPYRQETNRWLAEWFAARGEPMTDADVERLRQAFASPVESGLGLLPGAADALRWCKRSGLAVALVSNALSTGDAEMRRDWSRFGLSHAIDHIVSSYSTGWRKPHPAMYRRALVLAAVEPADAVMVGDDYELDVLGPKRLGIRAVWKGTALPDGLEARPEAVIGSLVELPATLQRLLEA